MAVGALTGAVIDLGTQLIQNGGSFDDVSWTSVGVSAAVGAGLSGLGPSGFLLGRGGARALSGGYNQAPGLINQGNVRFGWSYNAAEKVEVLSARVGRTHYDVPFISSTPGAAPIQEGIIAGTVGGLISSPSSPAFGTNTPSPATDIGASSYSQPTVSSPAMSSPPPTYSDPSNTTYSPSPPTFSDSSYPQTGWGPSPVGAK